MDNLDLQFSLLLVISGALTLFVPLLSFINIFEGGTAGYYALAYDILCIAFLIKVMLNYHRKEIHPMCIKDLVRWIFFIGWAPIMAPLYWFCEPEYDFIIYKNKEKTP